jgi:hypothetical protein
MNSLSELKKRSSETSQRLPRLNASCSEMERALSLGEPEARLANIYPGTDEHQEQASLA